MHTTDIIAQHLLDLIQSWGYHPAAQGHNQTHTITLCSKGHPSPCPCTTLCKIHITPTTLKLRDSFGNSWSSTTITEHPLAHPESLTKFEQELQTHLHTTRLKHQRLYANYGGDTQNP